MFALTAEQLFDQQVLSAMGEDPFAWRAMGDGDWQQRAAGFAGRLTDVLDWLQVGQDIEDMLKPPTPPPSGAE